MMMPEDPLCDTVVRPVAQLETSEGPLDILYRDNHLLAVHKPAGLLVHPSWIAPARTPSLARLLKDALPEHSIHPVHRLDRATSGVMLVALDPETARRMQEQFSDRQIRKTYLCLVRGWVHEDEGVIDYALKPIHDKIADAKSNPDKDPKPAVTHYRCLERIELPIPVGCYPAARYSLLEVRPQTGRKHQIRRHFKHLLHPLVGDTKYGEGRHNRLFRNHFDSHRLMLMATGIELDHPRSGETLSIRANLGNDIDTLFSRLGLRQVSDC